MTTSQFQWPLHTFNNKALERAALNHSSVKQRGGTALGCEAFDRLEFLGDRVVSLVVAQMLMAQHSQANEGELARRHTHLVRAETMADIAKQVKLEQQIKGEGVTLGTNVLADALEAYIGAVYLDAGFADSAALVQKLWADALLAQRLSNADSRDAKTRLQEWAQGRALGLPVYQLLAQTGPAHAPNFVVSVALSTGATAQAEGANRKQAEQAAAAVLLSIVEGKK